MWLFFITKNVNTLRVQTNKTLKTGRTLLVFVCTRSSAFLSLYRLNDEGFGFSWHPGMWKMNTGEASFRRISTDSLYGDGATV